VSEMGRCRDCRYWKETSKRLHHGNDKTRHGECEQGIRRVYEYSGHMELPTGDFGCALFKHKWGEQLTKDAWAEHRNQRAKEVAEGERWTHEQLTAISSERLRRQERLEIASEAMVGFCRSPIPMTAEEAARRSVDLADALLAEIDKEKP
jgi:hypothetical protein